MQFRNRGSRRPPILHREPMVGGASTADHARQEPPAQSLVMTLALRRLGPDDYDVMQDDEIVGRIYRRNNDRELWRWMIRLWEPPPGPSGGLADSLDAAMAAFRAKWDA